MKILFYFSISILTILSSVSAFYQHNFDNEVNGQLDGTKNEATNLLIEELQLNNKMNEEIEQVLTSIKNGMKTAEKVIRDIITSSYDKKAELERELEVKIQNEKQKNMALDPARKTEYDKWYADSPAFLYKDAVDSYAKYMTCPYILKYVVENFLTRYLSTPINETIRRQAELNEQLKGILYSPAREQYLFECLKNFSKLHFECSEFGEKFANAWKMLKNLENGLPSAGTKFPEYDSNEFESSNLQNLVDLYHATNQSIAEQIWKRIQWQDWLQLKTLTLTPSTRRIVRRLTQTRPKDLTRAVLDNLVRDQKEHQYALAVIEMAKLDTRSNEQQNLCLWTLYNSDHPHIDRVNFYLKKNWPRSKQSGVANRAYSFCEEYSILLDKASLLDYHLPGLHPPHLQVRPTYGDGHSFIDDLRDPLALNVRQPRSAAQILLSMELGPDARIDYIGQKNILGDLRPVPQSSGEENQHEKETEENRMEKEIAQALRSISANKNVIEELVRETIKRKYTMQIDFKRKFHELTKNTKQDKDELIVSEKNTMMIENQTNWGIEYLRKISCPVRLKFCLFWFLKTDQETKDELASFESTLMQLLNPYGSREILSSCVIQFSNLNTTSTEFQEVWKRMKNLPNRLQSTPAPMCRSTNTEYVAEFNESNADSLMLRDALIDLYNAATPSAAEQLWRNQRESVWKPRSRSTDLEWQDIGVITWLARARKEQYPQIAREAANNDMSWPGKFWYAMHVLTTGKLDFYNMAYSFKLCLWTLYNFNDEKRDAELEKQRPHMDRVNRTDLFCAQFALFHDMATLLSYKSNMYLPYPPTLKELKEYVHFLNKTRGPTAGFVAQTVLFRFEDE